MHCSEVDMTSMDEGGSKSLARMGLKCWNVGPLASSMRLLGGGGAQHPYRAVKKSLSNYLPYLATSISACVGNTRTSVEFLTVSTTRRSCLPRSSVSQWNNIFSKNTKLTFSGHFPAFLRKLICNRRYQFSASDLSWQLFSEVFWRLVWTWTGPLLRFSGPVRKTTINRLSVHIGIWIIGCTWGTISYFYHRRSRMVNKWCFG